MEFALASQALLPSVHVVAGGLGAAANPISSPVLEWTLLPVKPASVLEVANSTPPELLPAPVLLFRMSLPWMTDEVVLPVACSTRMPAAALPLTVQLRMVAATEPTEPVR